VATSDAVQPPGKAGGCRRIPVQRVFDDCSACYRLSASNNPNNTATNVVVTNSVRNENRQVNHGIAATAALHATRNQYGKTNRWCP
jgi:hypothetical protein